jgi:hypothetical protein
MDLRDGLIEAFRALLRERGPVPRLVSEPAILDGAHVITPAPRFVALDGSVGLGIGLLASRAATEGVAVRRGSPPQPGIEARYFSGRNFDMPIKVAFEEHVDFGWEQTPPPPAPLRPDLLPWEDMSAIWLGWLTPPADDVYELTTESDDGIRLWLDGVLVIDRWTPHGPTLDTANVWLDAGRWHHVRIEYFQGPLTIARAKLSWRSPGLSRQLIPSGALVRTEQSLPPPAGWRPGAPLPSPGPILTVGEHGPEQPGDPVAGLLGDDAHTFIAYMPSWKAPSPADQERARREVAALSPAHASGHVCFIEPRMRLGLQDRIGLNTYIGDGPPSDPLDEIRLDHSAFLGRDDPPFGLSVGEGRVGQTKTI